MSNRQINSPNDKNFTDSIADQRQFELLLCELSSQFIDIPADRIDAEIETVLHLIGQFFGIDRVTLTQFSENMTILNATHFYTAPNIPKPSIRIVNENIPWVFKKISQKEIIIASNVPKDLPDEAMLEKEYCKRSGIKSVLILPLKIAGQILGGLFFTSLVKPLNWQKSIVQQLQLAADIVTKALWGKEAAIRIDELLGFERILHEISANFITVACEEIDDRIAVSLQLIGGFLNADICSIAEFSVTENSYSTSHNWVSKQIDRPPPFIATQKTTPWLFNRWRKGRICKVENLRDLPKEAKKDREVAIERGIKSHLSVPFSVGGVFIGAIGINTIRIPRKWPDQMVRQIQLFGQVIANAIARKQSDLRLRRAFSEIKKLKEQLEIDNLYLREEIKLEHNFDEIIGQSETLKYALLRVQQVAPTDTNVLILGETGTGKELIARAIHNSSKRRNRPLIKVNCAAFSPNLIESELFGHEKGAFTGANYRLLGRFETADGATLFLDEIGELPFELQAKLLRVLQDGEFERVGSTKTLKVDVRIIAATNRDLEKESKRGNFRLDLWYRLNVFPISLTPLRWRREDIPILINWFLQKLEKKFAKRIKKIPAKTMNALQSYSWPGNVRELENILERSVIISKNGILEVELPTSQNLTSYNGYTLAEIEKNYIIKTLEKTSWKIQGVTGAATILGLKPSTLRNRMNKLGIQRPSI